MQEVAKETLPSDFSYAWAGQALQETQSGSTSSSAFIFGLVIVFLLLAVFGVLEIELALRISIITLVVTLVLIGWAAVHKIPLKWWQRLIALGAEAALAIGVIGLQFLAHSA